jgi:uncharacterized protein YcbK (DUF882 family)
MPRSFRISTSAASVASAASSAALFAALSLASADAWADVQHVVARGHTLDAIAHRYHVTVKAIVDANHLKDAQHLKVGETLTIPGVAAQAPAAAKGGKGKDEKKPVTYVMRAKTPGVVHATRLATNEQFTIRVSTRRGKQSPTAEKQAEQMLRSAGGLSHPIDPRLVALVGVVSNHFGSRRIEVISGFRPYTPTQHTTHSNHNIGKAIDFRVVGVPNEVVRDFCRSLKNTGCGYYPNSTFVHMDARTSSVFWVDYSRPGEPPRYNAANVDADEGTSDVGEEARVPPPSQDEDGLPEAESGPATSPSMNGPSEMNAIPAPPAAPPASSPRPEAAPPTISPAPTNVSPAPSAP